jgi:hypothetical protein
MSNFDMGAVVCAPEGVPEYIHSVQEIFLLSSHRRYLQVGFAHVREVQDCPGSEQAMNDTAEDRRISVALTAQTCGGEGTGRTTAALVTPKICDPGPESHDGGGGKDDASPQPLRITSGADSISPVDQVQASGDTLVDSSCGF